MPRSALLMLSVATTLMGCGPQHDRAEPLAAPSVAAAVTPAPVVTIPTNPPSPVSPTASSAAAPGQGIALGPALSLVQDIRPGSAISNPNQPALQFRIENRGTQTMAMTVAAEAPAQAGTQIWEFGYEPIPDISWLTVETAVHALPGGTASEVPVHIAIPAGREWENRRFVACVTLRPGARPGVGAGLALAARVLIDTSVNGSADAGAGAPIATIPARTSVTLAPGAQQKADVLLRWNLASDEIPELLTVRLADILPNEEARMRYRSPGTEEWPSALTTTNAPLAAKSGTWAPLHLTITAPTSARPGSTLEEIIVIGPADQIALAKNLQRTQQPMVALLRCVIHISAAAP